jgi:hypothetical protein
MGDRYGLEGSIEMDFRKKDVRVLTELNWLSIGCSGELL